MANLLKKMTSRSQREVISQYIHAVNTDKFDNARIIADELMDFFIEEDSSSKKADMSSKLYDKTMEYYEINKA